MVLAEEIVQYNYTLLPPAPMAATAPVLVLRILLVHMGVVTMRVATTVGLVCFSSSFGDGFSFSCATTNNEYRNRLSFDHRIPTSAFSRRNDMVEGPSSSSSSSAKASLKQSILETSLKEYEYDGWKLTYRFRPASHGFENESPMLLIHPVGIGLSSWFWERLESTSLDGPALIAPNLIGCGISEGSAEWDPDKRGLFIPLDWVKGCEALMNHTRESNDLCSPSVESRNDDEAKELSNSPLSVWNTFRNDQPWVVISQGGLAPIAVLLAARNPQLVGNVVLASPPQWKDMTTPMPEQSLSTNLRFFRGPLGRLAFDVLETSWAIRLFSNLFLFGTPCDDRWIERAVQEMGRRARPPVAVFNSGFVLNKSLEKEMLTIKQPVLLVEGFDDSRNRQEYAEKMIHCRISKVIGKNVLPWEQPDAFLEVVLDFVSRKNAIPNTIVGQ